MYDDNDDDDDDDDDRDRGDRREKESSAAAAAEEDEEEKDEEEDDDVNEEEAWRGGRGAVGAARAVGCDGNATSVDTARRRHRHVRKGAETEGKAGPGQDTTGHGASGREAGRERARGGGIGIESSSRSIGHGAINCSALHGSAEVRGALLRCVI